MTDERCKERPKQLGKAETASLGHDVKLPRAIRHDHVAGERDELQVRLGHRPLHLAHLHEGDEGVLEAVHEQHGDRDAAVEGGVACNGGDSFWPCPTRAAEPRMRSPSGQC